MARISCQAVSVFTLGSNALIDALQNGELVVENRDVESKGIKERWDDPIEVGSAWRVEADIYVDTSAEMVAAAAGSNPVVTVAITTGAGTYSGNALISMGSHSFKKDDLQMQKVTLKGKGALTLA